MLGMSLLARYRKVAPFTIKYQDTIWVAAATKVLKWSGMSILSMQSATTTCFILPSSSTIQRFKPEKCTQVYFHLSPWPNRHSVYWFRVRCTIQYIQKNRHSAAIFSARLSGFLVTLTLILYERLACRQTISGPILVRSRLSESLVFYSRNDIRVTVTRIISSVPK